MAPPTGTTDDVTNDVTTDVSGDVTTDATTVVGDVSYDLWQDSWGQSLGDVGADALPSGTEVLTGGFETPRNHGDQYAARLRALFTPTESGTYRFVVSGDDDARLFFNPAGVDPVGASLVAYIAGWTTYQQWDRYASQRTAWFSLRAGESYYLEAIGKEGSGDDSVAVGMQRSDGGPIQLIPAELIASTSLGEGGWRLSTPQGLPDVPRPLADPDWTTSVGISTATIGWAAASDATGYAVRLEGGGQVVTIETDTPSVTFERLVPDTRYLIEVAPMNAAGRQAAATKLFLTQPGPYPVPVAPPAAAADARPTVSWDRWDTGWWTLTSIPDGQPPLADGPRTLASGLETPPMQRENHAARLRAVLTPAATDDYTFHLSGDDDARLLFNPDGVSAKGAIAIAAVSGWTEQYQWDRYASQSSATFHLVRGQSYYIEVIGVHGLGFDHLEVGWSVPGGPIVVVPGEVLSPTRAGEGGWRRDATALPEVPDKPHQLQVDGTTTSLFATWTAPKVSDRHGAATRYEVIITGDAERTVWVESTELLVDGLPTGGQFWFEVVPWNEAGRGKSAAHTVHTLKKDLPGARDMPKVPGDSAASGDTVKLTGKQNDKGELVNQLAPNGVFAAPGEDVGIEPTPALPATSPAMVAEVTDRARVTRLKSIAASPTSPTGRRSDRGVGATGWADFLAARS